MRVEFPLTFLRSNGERVLVESREEAIDRIAALWSRIGDQIHNNRFCNSRWLTQLRYPTRKLDFWSSEGLPDGYEFVVLDLLGIPIPRWKLRELVLLTGEYRIDFDRYINREVFRWKPKVYSTLDRGYKRWRGRYRWLRHPRTSNEIRQNWIAQNDPDLIEHNIRIRGKRRPPNIPTAYHDISRNRERNWKRHRKQQWKR